MVDYSKWKTIEVSDDEDDTHPNVDTPSLFRWRHKARVERMAEHQKNKDELKSRRLDVEEQLRQLPQTGNECADSDVEDTRKQLETERKALEESANQLAEKERKEPWNVDTISKEGWSKTVVNIPAPVVDRSHLSEEELQKLYKDFVDKNEEKIKHFGLLGKVDDCERYLLSNQELVCEDTSNYLSIWCLTLEMQEKHSLMEFVAKQAVAVQYILQVAKQLDVDPRSCVHSFFNSVQKGDNECSVAFDKELLAFKARIKDRAITKLQEIYAKVVEDEERKARLGPGGLDPKEVFESLPECLQMCFESRDIPLLQETIKSMDLDEAEHHMKRCVDSGLWVPDIKDEPTVATDEDNSSESKVDEKQN